MSAFTSLVDWCEPCGGKYFRTTKPVMWELGVKGSGLWVTVPVGYVFDVSIPRALWLILDPTDERFLKAACLHDYSLHVMGWDKVSAAALFSGALTASGVRRALRLIMVVCVIAWRFR